MKELTYKQFAEAFLSLVPDFPMDGNEVEQYLEKQGLIAFTLFSSYYDMGLFEMMDLLSNLEKGGIQHGKG